MKIKALLAAAALSFTAFAAHAAPVSITFDSIGDITDNTTTTVDYNGGSGIPTDPAALTEVTLGSGETLLLGILATPRFASPSVGTDGAGRYVATVGDTPSAPGTSSWNISFFAEITGGAMTIADAGLELLFDFDPGTGTDSMLFGIWDLSATAAALAPTTQVFQTSQNATFGTFEFGAGFPTDNKNPFITRDAANAFNKDTPGEYLFSLRSSVFDAEATIAVETVPLPASALILMSGVAAFSLFRRKRARS